MMDHPSAIRRAVHSDLNALCHIERECFGSEAFSRRQLHHLALKARGICLVTQRNGETAGYISLLLRENTCNIRIYSVAVAPIHRGCGIAKLLIEAAIDFAQERHRTSITLEVDCSNTAAIALYEGFGFRRTERLRNYYHTNDGWRMTKELA